MSAAVVGYIAAAVCVTAFVPQVWKVLTTRDTKDLSALMWMLETVGFALWIWYGVKLSALPIIIPNAICSVLAAFILAMKLTESRRSSGRSARRSRSAPPPPSTSPRETSGSGSSLPVAASTSR